ncbi:hypothetical protein CIB84_016957, partial [Bambusicola thoracicus]
SNNTVVQAAGDLSAQEAREEGALQQLCMDILGSLDVSGSGMTKLLWPRLLLYVVPAQYTGMLIPVSHCVRALAERGDLMVRELEELDSHFLSSMFQGPLLIPQTLLARLLVVAGSAFADSELQAAALLLMLHLHSRIHRAVGAMWATEIPLLLQCLEGKALVGREGRRQGRGGGKMKLCSVPEGKHCLQPSTCSAAAPIAGRQH